MAPLVISWGLAPLIGTVVGGAIGLVLIVLLPVVLVLRRRHRHAVARLQDDAIAELADLGNTEKTVKHRSLPRISIIPAEAENAGYNALPSKENMREEYKQDAKRKRKSRDLLSWPLPGRKLSKRTVSGSSQLSTISENSQAQAAADAKRNKHLSGAPSSPQPGASPSVALRPAPLFSSRTTTRAGLERSVSVPSILTVGTDISEKDEAVRTASRDSRSRSYSLGSLTAQKSSETLPPLPALPTGFANNIIKATPKHLSDISMTSLSSVDTTTSSILKQANSPPIGASTSFNHRHPEVGLGLQIHDKDAVFKQSVLEVSPDLSRNTPSTQIDAHRRSLAEVHTAESIRLQRISASPTPSSIKALTTPRRDAHMRKASYCGSPEDRQQISVFREVSGNSGMLSRDISQASFMTIDSVSTTNPFQYSPTPPQFQVRQPLKSALKRGSPGMKKLARQGQVRVLSNPTSYWAPEFTRSPSTMSMADIREEGHEDEIEIDITDYPSPSPFEMDEDYDGENLLSSPASDRQTRPTSLTASLTPKSQALFTTSFEHDQDSGKGGSQIRQSVASSMISLSTFPVPSGSQNWERISRDDTHRSSMISNTVPSSPESPTIPGLPLLNQGSSAANTMSSFPKLELDSSTLNFNPPSQDEHHGPGPALFVTPPRNVFQAKQDEQNASDHANWPLQARPLSLSSHPLKTKPDFTAPPPNSGSTLAPPSRLSGPRQAPPKSTMTMVKGLRRENSEIKHILASSNNKEARRYASLGRQLTPDMSSSSNDLWSIPGSAAQSEPEAGDLGISVWEDGEQAWPSSPPQQAPSTPSKSSPLRTPTTDRAEKRKAWTGTPGSSMEDQENMAFVDVPITHGNVF